MQHCRFRDRMLRGRGGDGSAPSDAPIGLMQPVQRQTTRRTNRQEVACRGPLAEWGDHAPGEAGYITREHG